MREMRDSGNMWIGATPETWKMIPLKYLASYNDEVLSENTDDEFEFDYIEIGSVQYGRGIIYTEHMKFKNAPSRARRIVRKDDIIVSTVRTYLKAVATIPACNNSLIASTGFIVIRPHKVLPRFMNYALLSESFISLVESHSTGISYPAINSVDVVKFKIPVPCRSEQERIAAFLDAECAEIDTVLEKTHASIEEYKKLKQAVITQAVTKGIRGDRPMKDSGIEWIGDIPAEWRKTQLRHCAAIKSGITLGKKYEKTDSLVERPYLRVANVQDGYVDLSVLTTIEVTQDEDLKYRLRAGDVLMTEGGDRDKLGRGCVWHGEIEPCLHQNHIFAVQTSKDTLLPEFLEYLTVSDVGRSYFDVTAIKTTNLACTSSSKVLAFTIPLPSVEEQAEIVEALNTKCAGIDALVAKKQQYLTEIENYKKSLIYEYVTGKKEVHPL